MYRNALVAIDGSNVASAVLAHAKEVVDPQGNITIVEVIDDIARVFAQTTPAGFEFGSAAIASGVAEEIVQAQRDAAGQHLAAAREALGRDGLANCETVILSGRPGEAIVAEVAARGSDVVLMGTHGRSGLRRTVLGSVADHVLRHLDEVPVLLVHAREE